MTETLSSTLNPSADVFIPGKSSNLKDSTNPEGEMKDVSAPFRPISKTKKIDNYSSGHTKEIAKQLLLDYLAEKKNRGEKTITRREIAKIVEKVLSANSCKVNPKIIPIEARLSTLPEVGKLKDVEAENEIINYRAAKPFTFDLSVFKPPKPSPFLLSLYGLYRHEQAVRPLLSLTLPPSNLKDNAWSITSKDLSLWNPSCGEPCSCPPMFGYSLPPSFFGNLFNLDYKCSKEEIHFCRYPPSENGNESVIFNIKTDHPVEVDLLEDCFEDESKRESNLEFYSEQLKTIVSGVCDSISDEKTEEVKTSSTEDSEVNENYQEMFWDSDQSEFVRSEEIREDDGCHPLLEMEYPEPNEGVTPEIHEMLRKCLSPDYNNDAKESEIDEGINTTCCDPPCSIWCQESPKFERSDSVSSSSSVSANIGILTDTTDFLLNASNGSIPSNGGTDVESNFHKRIFKRSFSANDCDLSYAERYKVNHEIPQISTSSREDLEFLRRDPINFFKSLRKSDSWKDNDSGIVTQWSSQEEIDIYSDMREGYYEFDQDHAPMWSLFNGEDSLWKPLPECAQDQHSKFMPKRVRDLRRQRSVN